jgi:monofunctional biosynthetic peptidoglycan transglycosylase
VTAVLVAEDARFFTHHGVDWEAVKAARARNRRFPRRRPIGASTITQQLAKNLWLSSDRSWFRKGREAAIALTMDLLLPKRTILEHYLSGIEWGERVWGCEAAARRYFGRSAASLTRAQAAWLAAMIPGPRVFLANPGRHERRAARILSRMAKTADVRPLLLEEAEADDAR